MKSDTVCDCLYVDVLDNESVIKERMEFLNDLGLDMPLDASRNVRHSFLFSVL